MFRLGLAQPLTGTDYHATINCHDQGRGFRSRFFSVASGLRPSARRSNPIARTRRVAASVQAFCESEESGPKGPTLDLKQSAPPTSRWLTTWLTTCSWRLNRSLREKVAPCSRCRRGISSLSRPLQGRSERFL